MQKWVFLFFLILGGVPAPHCAFADQPSRTLTLNVSVTNPSTDQTREMDFKTELPLELKREDIISSDGLNVVYDFEHKVVAVQGKVNLRPGETIYYRILVRDVWLIPEDDFDSLQMKAKDLKSSKERDSVLQLLSKIKARQERGFDKVLDHISTYRENRKELEAIRSELLTEQSAGPYHSAVGRPWSLIVLFILGPLAAMFVLFFLGKKRIFASRPSGNFLKLPDDIKIDCVLLPQGDVAPSPNRSMVKERGISMIMDERFREHAAVEIKVSLPESGDALVFAGFVVKQSPFTVEGKVRFETFVSLVEAGENSYETLRQYVQTRPED